MIMKVIQYKDVASTRFDNEVAKGIDGRVVIGKADQANNFCMRVFEIEPNGHTPRHTHAWEHEIFVHQGTGQVFNQGNWDNINAGSIVFVPGDEEHQFKNTGDSPLVFACLIPSDAPEL